jgi:hypothetical protein
MWGNWNFCAILLGMKNGTISVQAVWHLLKKKKRDMITL